MASISSNDIEHENKNAHKNVSDVEIVNADENEHMDANVHKKSKKSEC